MKTREKNQTFLFNFMFWKKALNYFGKGYEICLNVTSLFI